MVAKLDMNLVRPHFPALSGKWTYLDNAGGTQTAIQVGRRLQEYLYHTNVQLGASYEISKLAGQRVKEAQLAMAEWINARDASEIVLGPSTTQLLQNLSKSMIQLFRPGDEVIVTNCDHEANIGPWVKMAAAGIVVKTWKIRPDTLRLHLEDLESLLTERTRLVAFTHISNILGTINPVKEFTSFIHRHHAMVCVDGVAAVPHRLPDVQDLEVDFYVFSLYKVFGPHYSLLYARREHLEKLPGIGHYFIEEDDIPYKLQPGNVNFELTYSLLGVMDYFRTIAAAHDFDSVDLRGLSVFVYNLIARHEEALCAGFLEFLKYKKGIRIIGEPSPDRGLRVPTISFISEKYRSDEIVSQVDPHLIGIRYGDFYARRLIDGLGLSLKNGVVRVSMVHYNCTEELERLKELMDRVL
jgi:cysteine desulfurase family protein (TIGR01976 family)